jgi:hypothetical protein
LPWAGISRPFRANSSIVDPTDLLDPTDPSEKPTNQTEIPLAIPSVEAALLQNFPSFPCFPWTKNGLWAAAHASFFVPFVVKKLI